MFHFTIGANPEELRAIMARLTSIEGKLDAAAGKEKQEMAQLDDLVAKVRANTSVIESAKIAFAGLVAQLKASQGDPDKIAALIQTLDTDDNSLAAAIAENTSVIPTAAAGSAVTGSGAVGSGTTGA